MKELGIAVIYSTASNVLVYREQMEERAEKYGIPFELLPKEVGEESLFKRVTSSMTTNICKNEEPLLCRELPKSKSPNNTVVRVFEKRDADNDARKVINGESSPVFRQLATMFFNKDTYEIKYNIFSEEGRDIVNRVMADCSVEEGFSTEKEIRTSIQKAFDLFMGVKLRKNGGVEFIPAQNIPLWEKYSKIFKGYGCVEFVEVSVCDDARGKVSVYNGIEDDIKGFFSGEIYKFGEECDTKKPLRDIVLQFKGCVDNNEIKIDALNNMYNRFVAYVKKVKMYKELIGSDLDDIYFKVRACKDYLQEILEERELFD